MGRTPCCTKVGLIRGAWTSEEDLRLSNYIQTHGEGGWRTLPRKAGLLRCGKSCRLRWMNYLRPDVKRDHITPEEEDLILRLHRLLGNRWSLIAGRIPGRTDNDIKNYWNTQLSKKLINQGIDPRTHKPLSETLDVYVNSDNSDVSPKFLEQDLPSSTYLPGPRLPVPDHKEDEFVLCPPNDKVIENGFNQIAVYDHVSLDTSFLKGHVSCINKSIPPPDISPELISTPYTMHGKFTPSLKNSENNQFCSAPLMLTTVSSAAGGHETYNDYFMNKNVMSSHEYDIKSLHPQTPAFLGQQNLAHVSVSSNISFAKQFFQGSEMELQNCDIQVPPLATVYNKSSNTNWTAPSLSSSHAAPMSDVEPAFGDYSSDMFSSMLESFANEEMHLQNSQLCLNQPEPAHLPHDLWSLVYPIAGDDSSRSLY